MAEQTNGQASSGPPSPRPTSSTTTTSSASSSNALNLIASAMESPKARYYDFPELKVNEVTEDIGEDKFFTGPDEPNHQFTAELDECFYARSVSSYPGTYVPGKPKPPGYPICDRFSVSLLNQNRGIVVIADGCNWGERPKEAAEKASLGFLNYLKAQQHKMTNSHKAGHHLLIAISMAHQEILKGKRDTLDCGTTTLLGGLLLPIKDEQINDGKSILFLSANIGDCKAFHICSKTGVLSDLTTANREASRSARDPGGRLGPYIGRNPDLRNLSLSFVRCYPEDLLFVVSDGIHDNLDAEYLGLYPKDVDLPSFDQWKDVVLKEAQAAKTVYRLKLMTKLLQDAKRPKEIVNRLVDHALVTTESSRDFLINNSKSKLPEDYLKYPGKMDHTTCCCVHPGVIIPELRPTLYWKESMNFKTTLTLKDIITKSPTPASQDIKTNTPSGIESEASKPTAQADKKEGSQISEEEVDGNGKKISRSISQPNIPHTRIQRGSIIASDGEDKATLKPPTSPDLSSRAKEVDSSSATDEAKTKGRTPRGKQSGSFIGKNLKTGSRVGSLTEPDRPVSLHSGTSASCPSSSTTPNISEEVEKEDDEFSIFKMKMRKPTFGFSLGGSPRKDKKDKLNKDHENK